MFLNVLFQHPFSLPSERSFILFGQVFNRFVGVFINVADNNLETFFFSLLLLHHNPKV